MQGHLYFSVLLVCWQIQIQKDTNTNTSRGWRRGHCARPPGPAAAFWVRTFSSPVCDAFPCPPFSFISINQGPVTGLWRTETSHWGFWARTSHLWCISMQTLQLHQHHPGSSNLCFWAGTPHLWCISTLTLQLHHQGSRRVLECQPRCPSVMHSQIHQYHPESSRNLETKFSLCPWKSHS